MRTREPLILNPLKIPPSRVPRRAGRRIGPSRSHQSYRLPETLTPSAIKRRRGFLRAILGRVTPPAGTRPGVVEGYASCSAFFQHGNSFSAEVHSSLGRGGGGLGGSAGPTPLVWWLCGFSHSIGMQVSTPKQLAHSAAKPEAARRGQGRPPPPGLSTIRLFSGRARLLSTPKAQSSTGARAGGKGMGD